MITGGPVKNLIEKKWSGLSDSEMVTGRLNETLPSALPHPGYKKKNKKKKQLFTHLYKYIWLCIKIQKNKKNMKIKKKFLIFNRKKENTSVGGGWPHPFLLIDWLQGKRNKYY